MKIQNAEFFARDCVELAKALLGKTICVKHGDTTTKKTITETEAYGINDSACHCFKGHTKRNAPMFEAGGTVYVYLCYGIHEILNISAGNVGEGQGVMLRGVKRVEHIEHRNCEDMIRTVGNVIGPGLVTKVLGVDRSYNNEFLPDSTRIWLEDGITVEENNIECLKRVGIGYATQADQDKLWRFRILSTGNLKN